MPYFVPKSRAHRARRTLRSVAVVAVMAVVAALLSLAGGTASAFADSDSASVSGTVTDASTSQPIAGADVQISTSDNSYIDDVTTASDGTYTLSGIPAGSYTLQFNGPNGAGYVQQCWKDVQCFTGVSTYFSVADGQVLTGYDAQLVVGATISGTVYGADNPGVGLAGVSISADSASGIPGFAVTDQNGNYSITGLAPGGYQLDFQGSGNYLSQWYNDQPTQATAQTVTVAAAGTATGIDATLAVGASISGTVTDASGNPVASVDVTAQSTDGSGFGFATTDSNGNYSIEGLTTDDYTVEFEPTQGNVVAQYWNDQPTSATANLVDVASGASVTGINAQLSAGGTISGTVSTGAGPLAGATVAAISPTTGITGEEPTTDANGNYTIVGLPAGSYTVEFYAPQGQNLANQFWDNATSAATATPVTVSASTPATGIDATMVTGATISGTIYAPGTPKVGLANAYVNVFPASGGEQIAGAATDSNGNYEVTNLDPGSYTIEFQTGYDSGVVAEEWWGGTFIQTGAKSLTLAQGQARKNVDQQLIVGSPISGTVTLGGNTPAPAVNDDVYIWPSDETPGTNDQPPLSALTDSSGNYTLPNMGPGKYTIQIESLDPNWASQWWNGKPTQAKAKVLVVKKNVPVTGVNATLAPVIITPGTPAITGKARVGATLTAHPGSWKPSNMTFTYQWLADGQPIANATATTYVPTVSQLGDTISVAVTGTTVAYESQGLSQTIDSAATAAIKKAS